MRLKDRLEHGKDLYEEFVAKLTLYDFRVIQKTKQEFARVNFFFLGLMESKERGQVQKRSCAVGDELFAARDSAG